MINLNYVRRLPLRDAIAARAVYDPHDLLGFYGNDLVIAEEEGRAVKVTELRELIPPLSAIDVLVV
jgi:hypothetical protein